MNLRTWIVALPLFFLCPQSHAQSLPVETLASAVAIKPETKPEQPAKSDWRVLMPNSRTPPVTFSKEPILPLTKAIKGRLGEPFLPLVPTTHLWKPLVVFPASKAARNAQQSVDTANEEGRFQWGKAIKQSLLFLGIQHGFAMTQDKTRRELRGPFLKDYFRSASKLGGWEDGGRFFTNYISHPMEGSVAGFIQIQNDPQGIRQEFGKSRSYWKSRMKAMAWNAAYSTQFELGPISQSSLGNVGLHTSLDGKKRKMAYVDLVVTPTLGTVWLIGEDMLDRYVVRRWEGSDPTGIRHIALRMFLNPMRATANLLRFKLPWHRDR